MYRKVPPSGGSLEIGNRLCQDQAALLEAITSSPFGGIPRNWKLTLQINRRLLKGEVPPSGGSLEIGNC